MHARLAGIGLGTGLALYAVSSAAVAQTPAAPALRYYAPLPPAAHPRVIETDLCVYGGTPGGLGASIQMRLLGKRAALMEFGRHLGGMTASGLGRTDFGNKAAIGGIAHELYRRLEERLESVRKDGNRIVEIVMESGDT